MPLISWAYRPSPKVPPGTIEIGWSLSSPDVEVRWYLAPKENGYPSTYMVGTTSAQFSISDPGMYIFHLEARDQDGETEERVVMFEVITEVEDEEESSPIRMVPMPIRRAVRINQTYDREIPYRGQPDSHDENRWIQSVIEDIRSLSKHAEQLEKELALRTSVSTIEAAASEAMQKRRQIQLASRASGSTVQTIFVDASMFLPGMPPEAGTQDTEAIVDPVFGEIAPALSSEPEHKLGWPTKDGLRLPSTLSIMTHPHEGSFIETDPRYAIDGRPQTAWIREIYLPPNKEPDNVIYRVSLPSGFGASRVANRLDLSCLPAYGVNLTYVKLFDGTSWKLIHGWPKVSTIHGIHPRPIADAGPLRLRFPDQVVAGIEVAIQPKYFISDQSQYKYLAGLYHLALYYDPVAWNQPSQAHVIIPATDLPPYPIRITDISPSWFFPESQQSVDFAIYRITGAGSWIHMRIGDVVAGEGVGIVCTVRPDASQGWPNVLRGISLSYEMLP